MCYHTCHSTERPNPSVSLQLSEDVLWDLVAHPARCFLHCQGGRLHRRVGPAGSHPRAHADTECLTHRHHQHLPLPSHT